jgi:hypothetical protein
MRIYKNILKFQKKVWWAGDQLNALQYYLNKSVKILFDYIKATMREGNTKQFKSIKEMEEYLNGEI